MAIDAILRWISKQPDWQQDALRRVAVSPELTDGDVSAILVNLKNSKGLPQKGEAASQPLTEDHLQSDAAKAPLVHLCSIGNVKNANRLAAPRIRFCRSPLMVLRSSMVTTVRERVGIVEF